jgi:hypothetical protein
LDGVYTNIEKEHYKKQSYLVNNDGTIADFLDGLTLVIK